MGFAAHPCNSHTVCCTCLHTHTHFVHSAVQIIFIELIILAIIFRGAATTTLWTITTNFYQFIVTMK